jgi:hypothetical protein
MAERKSRLDVQVEKTENLVNYLLRKKKENIQNSLVRPLYQEALKSLFFVCVLLIDVLIPLELFRVLPVPFNIVVSLGFLGAFLYIEIVIYNLLWGKKGRWALEKYKNLSKQDIEQKENT